MRLKQIHGVAVENLPTADGQNFDPAKFKLLLNHRKVELAGAGLTPPTFPFLGGFNPAVFGLGGREGGEGGLDLRYKTLDDDLEDSEMSEAGSDKKDSLDDKAEERKSRRKPAAPQWVNPDWESEGAGEDGQAGQEPINGVCVRNIAAFGEENSENIAEDEAS